MYHLEPITKSNRHHVNQLRAGADEIGLLHYNAYWVGQASLIDDIWVYLVFGQSNAPVGFVALGACYDDEYLSTNRITGVGEVYHLVISPNHQRCGAGTAVMHLCETLLIEKGFASMRVAHAPDNAKAAAFYAKLNFTPIGQNYDGDPYLERFLPQND